MRFRVAAIDGLKSLSPNSFHLKLIPDSYAVGEFFPNLSSNGCQFLNLQFFCANPIPLLQILMVRLHIFFVLIVEFMVIGVHFL